MARVKATAAEPYGEPPALNPMCQALQGMQDKAVAIIGNGPLTAQSRAEILKHRLVLR